MNIIKLQDSKNTVFEKIVEWNYNWWGIPEGKSVDEVRCIMEHSLNVERLPQTFVAVLDGEAVGMYQISMHDDLSSRPDIYPWLINVYVDEKFRGRNICRQMMATVKNNAKSANLTELYLYTSHIGLYEKFGWKFVEEVKTFKEKSPIERLYKLSLE